MLTTASSCATAFGHPLYGAMLLKTSMALSEALVELTMMLARRPDLLARRQRGPTAAAAADDDNRKSVAESSAEIIQKIFTTCLTDRSSARDARPQGKKVGVYMFANLVLKLLFAVGAPLTAFGPSVGLGRPYELCIHGSALHFSMFPICFALGSCLDQSALVACSSLEHSY